MFKSRTNLQLVQFATECNRTLQLLPLGDGNHALGFPLETVRPRGEHTPHSYSGRHRWQVAKVAPVRSVGPYERGWLELASVGLAMASSGRAAGDVRINMILNTSPAPGAWLL